MYAERDTLCHPVRWFESPPEPGRFKANGNENNFMIKTISNPALFQGRKASGEPFRTRRRAMLLNHVSLVTLRKTDNAVELRRGDTTAPLVG